MQMSQARLYVVLIVFLIINQVATYLVVKQAQKHTSVTFTKPSIPLSKPSHSLAAIKVWANTAAIDLFAYNFKNIDVRINDHAKYFSIDEWAQYLDGIKKTQLIQKVHEQHLVVSAVAAAPVHLVERGEVAGKYQWTVSLPLLVTYTGPNSSMDQKLSLEIKIARAPSPQGVDGLNIIQFVIKPTMVKKEEPA